MAYYKATLKFESCAECWVEADDEAGARAVLENISEADLRQATLWKDLFRAINNRSVISIAEQ
jgi:hypothetical protein